MATLRIRAERSMAAPPERVYRCIADYRAHHSRFLPPAFSHFQVVQGGVGAGTEIRFHLKAGARCSTMAMSPSLNRGGYWPSGTLTGA
jgi:uncharacterized protein YndB with AHSA1/START domain